MQIFYLESTCLKMTSGELIKGHLDSLPTSKDLEALLIEQSENGYDLVSSSPIEGSISMSGLGIRTAVALMAKFKKGD